MAVGMEKVYDIAIIGGGMVGAAAAYHCSRRGMSTILVERKHLAGGGSGGNFGLVLPTTGRFDVAGNLAFEKEGARRIAALTEELDFDIEYRPAHGYCLLVSEEEIAMFTAHCNHFVANGLFERFISPQELREEEPHLFVGPEILSVLQTDEGVLNPLRLVHGFWRGARHAGADLLCYSPVIKFEFSGAKVTKIVTPSQSIAVGQVALAAGAWTRSLGSLLNVEFPEYFILAEAVVTEPLPRLLNGFAYWGNVLRIPAETHIANQALSDGWETLGDKTLFSSYDFGTVQTRRGNVLLGQLSYITPPIRSQVSHAVIHHSAFEGLRLFPQLKKARIISSWRSPAPFTPDHLPLIGQVMPYDNVFIASGFQSAITACHWSGEYISILAGGDRLPEEARIFDPMRFQGRMQ
jgi:glycine/D-amino acid oxidase-like deaminating enzyme